MPVRTQACDPIRKLHVFQVQGSGEFPFDMLRYDSCWPSRSDPDVIAMAPHHRSSRLKEKRTVELVGLREPTAGRWESFGWRVV
jgi:hypothetical protein